MPIDPVDSLDPTPPAPDLQFHFTGGNLVLCTPISEAAQAWLDEHVSDEALWHGPSLCVEARYVDGLVAGAQGDGLSCGADQ